MDEEPNYQKHFANALVSFNEGVAEAANILFSLHKDVGSKRKRQRKQASELAEAKNKMAEKRLKFLESHEKEQALKNALVDRVKQLGITQHQSAVAKKRIEELEQIVPECDSWKTKAAIAEKQKEALQLKLSTIKTALRHLAVSPRLLTTSPMTSPMRFNDPKPEAEPEPVVIDSRFKTRLCVFHQKGECSKGKHCLYAHGRDELRLNPGKYHKDVSAVAAMGFDVDVGVIGALFQEHNGNTNDVLQTLLHD